MDSSVARALADAGYLDQRDREGRLLTEHAERVASVVAPEARALAFLREVVARTDMSYEELRANGLTVMEASALELLTQLPDESYTLYILRIAHAPEFAGRLARAVEIADLDEHLGRERRARSSAPHRTHGHAVTSPTFRSAEARRSAAGLSRSLAQRPHL